MEMEPERIEYLRSVYGNLDDHDIFLAHDIDDPVATMQNFPLYDAIEDSCLKLGHKAAVLHKVVKLDGDPDEVSDTDTHDLTAHILMPQAKLFVCHVGVNTVSLGYIIHIAQRQKKPGIYLLETGAEQSHIRELETQIFGCSLAVPERQQSMPFKPKQASGTPEIAAVIVYNGLEDCIRQLEPEIRMFFERN